MVYFISRYVSLELPSPNLFFACLNPSRLVDSPLATTRAAVPSFVSKVFRSTPLPSFSRRTLIEDSSATFVDDGLCLGL